MPTGDEEEKRLMEILRLTGAFREGAISSDELAREVARLQRRGARRVATIWALAFLLAAMVVAAWLGTHYA